MLQHTQKPVFESVWVVFHVAHLLMYWVFFLSYLWSKVLLPSSMKKPTHLSHPPQQR